MADITLGTGHQDHVFLRDGTSNTITDFRSIYFAADLDEDQEVPPNPDTPAEGTGAGVLNFAQTRFTFSLALTGIDLDGNQTPGTTQDNMTDMHIHGAAAPGVSAGVIFAFRNDAETIVTPAAGTVTGGWDADEIPAVGDMTPAHVTSLINGLTYFNIHTVLDTSGQIRGQILAQDQGLDRIDLTAQNIGSLETLLLVTDNVGGDAVITTFLNGVASALTLDGLVESDLLAGFFVFAGDVNQTINGTANRDDLFGAGGDDSASGAGGDDRLFGEAGADTLNGGAGADAMDGGAGDDLLQGNDDSDSANGGTGQDTVGGGKGNDTVLGAAGNDVLNGGEGDDSLQGNDGNDSENGGAGQDTVAGGKDNDTLFGGAGNDSVLGGNGNDSVYGGTTTSDTAVEADTLSGGEGGDFVQGNGGNDQVNGDAGGDTAGGGAGNDTVNGGADSDQVNGGGGTDTLSGGTGGDTLTGGLDNDSFVFLDGDGADTVGDFADNGVEKFDLSGLVAGAQNFGELVVTDTAGPGVTVNYGTGSFLVSNINTTGQIDAGDFLF